MRGQKRGGFRGRRFRGVPPLEHDCGARHTVRGTLQARHVLCGAQAAILARAVLMPVDQDKR